MVQALEVAALALPVADRVIDKFELAQTAEIGDRENAIENALETGIFTLARQQVHLQEPLIRFLLDLDQVRDRDRSLDLREIYSFADSAFCRDFAFSTPTAERLAT